MEQTDRTRAEPSTEQAVSSDKPAVREIDSAQLLAGEKEVFIRHLGELYRLRVTRNDKLILQK